MSGMTLSFQHKLTLKNGSVVLYHEAMLQSGKPFHVLIVVPGTRIEEYFNYIATRENFPVKELETYGEILSCDVGVMSEIEIMECFKEWR